MAVYNPRLDLSRQAGGSPQVQSLSQILKNQALESTAGGLVRRNIYEDITANKAKAPDVGGWKGVLQDVLESPAGKAFSKAGEIISLPGRVVTSAVQEFADAWDSDPNTVASWNDFGKQVNDPTFGFGTVIGDATGNKWIDRALGFIGDTALDPLTYMTLGASKGMSVLDEAVEAGTKSIKITGRAGREALGARVLKFTGDADLAKQVVRYGRSALRHQADDLFERMGLDRAGLYFMGKRIPASARVGQVLESGLTNMRVWSGDHIFSKPAQWFTPDDVNLARTALQRGTAPTERVETYLRVILSQNEQRAVKAAEKRWVQQEMKTLVSDIGENNLRSVQKTLHQVLEAPDPKAIANISGISTDAAEKVSAFFDKLWNRVDEASRAADPNVKIGKIDKYFHHMLTDDASAFLQAGRSKNARDLAEILFNPIKDTGAFRNRMQVGDEFFGKVLEENDLTVGALNKIARDAGFKGDFFETDLAVVLNKYADQYASQMGTIARRKYLVDNGVPILQSTVAKGNDEAIKSARALVKNTLKSSSDNAKAAGKAIDKVLDSITRTLDSTNVMLKQAITDVGEERTNALSQVVVSGVDKLYLTQALDEAESLLEEKVGALASLYSEEPPMLVTLLEQQHQKALDAVTAAKNDLENLTTSAQSTAEKMLEIKTLIDDAETTRNGILEFGNALEEHLDDVFAGKKIAGGKDAPVPQFLRELKAAVGDSVDVAGTRRKNVEEFVRGPEWAEINRYAPLSQNDIINTSYEQVQDIVIRSMRGEANVGEVRTAVAWYASAFPQLRDMQPELWKQMFEGTAEVPSMMARAAKADEFFSGVAIALNKDKEYLRLADMDIRLNAVNAEVRDSFQEYVAAQKMLRDVLGDNPNAVLPLPDGSSLSGGLAKAQFEQDATATLKMWLRRPEYEPIARRFESFLLPEDELIGYVGVPKSFTFEELIKRVRGVVDEFRTTRNIEIDLNPVGMRQAVKELEITAPRKMTIAFKDFADDLDLLIKHGTDDDIATYADAVISGKRVKSLADEIDARTGSAAKARGGGRRYQMREQLPEGKSVGSRMSLEGKMIDLERTMDERAKMIDAEIMLGGDAEVPQMNQLRDRLDREAIRGSLIDMVNREAARDSIAGRMARVRKEINALSPKLNVSTISHQAMKESQHEMQRALLAFQFNAEVSRRLDRAIMVMVDRGLMPDEGMVRKIVNHVARQQLESLGSESDVASRVMWRLQSILNDVRAGAYTDSRALHMAITQAIDDDAASGIISRHLGAGDARRIRQEFIKMHGGKSGQTGRLGIVQDAERVLASTTATAEEKAAAQKVIRSYKSRSSLGRERTAYINDVLVPWYESVYGKARRKPTLAKIDEALKAHGSSKIANHGALGVDASIGDMTTWLQKTVESVYAGTRPARQTTAWLKKAADPFVDPDEIRIGQIGWGTDLPTFLAGSLERVARNIEEQSKIIARKETQLAEVEGRAAVAAESASELSVLRASLETPMGQRTPLPMSQQTFAKATTDDLVNARRVVQRLDALKNDGGGAYFAALERQQLHDLLNVFAGVRPNGTGTIKVPIIESHVERARKMLMSDPEAKIYLRKGDQWVHVAEPSHIPDDANIGDIAYLDRTKSFGNVREQRANSLKAQERYRKQMLRAENLELRGKTKQAERIRTAAEAELMQDSIGSGGFREQNLTFIVSGNKESLENEVQRLKFKVLKLESDKLAAINSTSNGNKGLEIVAEIQKQIDEANAAGYAVLQQLRSPERPTYFKYNGVDVEFTEAEWESLFISGGDMPNQKELADELARVDREIDSMAPKSIYEMELGTVQGKIANRTKSLKQAREAEELGRQVQREVLPNFTREATSEGMPLSRSTLRDLGVGGQSSSVTSIEEELSMLTAYRERIRMLLEASKLETQQSALEKARLVHQAIKSGDLSMDSISKGFTKMPSATPSIVASRRNFLESVFGKSEEKMLLDEVAQLEESVGSFLYRRVVASSEKADATVERLMSAADDIRMGSISKRTGERLGGLEANIKLSTELERDLWATLGKITRRTGGAYDARARWTELASATKNQLSQQEIARKISEEVAALPTTGKMYRTVVSAKDARAELYNLSRRAERTAARMSKDEMAIDVAKARLETNQSWADYWASEYEKVRTPYEKAQGKRAKAALKEKTSAQAKREKAKRLADEAIEKYDNARVNAEDIVGWSERTIAGLTDKQKLAEEIITEASGMKGLGARTPEQLVEVMDWLDRNESVFEYLVGKGTDEVDALKRFRADLQNQYFGMLASNNADAVAKRIQGALDNGTFAQTFEQVVDKGMVSLAHVGLPSYQGPDWMKELFVNASRLKQPDFARSVGRFTRKYTSFFKAYAVSSPGFVVRNTISNTFMLIAAGSSLNNLGSGLELYGQFIRAVKAGRVEEWLSELTAKSPQLGERARLAVKVMDASGYGRSAEALASFSPKRKWLVDNRYVQTFRKWNEATEGSARFMLAYDSVAKGADFDTATARVKRFLFDYEDVSMGDEVMRTFVPFWFWMSRNLPMQMVNIYENPRAYLLYNRAMKAIGQEDPEGYTPSWIKEQGGVYVGGSMYLAPDMGFNRVGEQLKELQDPKRLLSYVNPILRVPFETALSSRRFYNDVPFSNKGQETVGGPLSPAVDALAALLGQQKPLAGGGTGVSDKMNYAAMNLIPPLAQSERLIPSTDLYKGRQAGSLLSYLGVPLRQVTPQMRESERKRQANENKKG